MLKRTKECILTHRITFSILFIMLGILSVVMFRVFGVSKLKNIELTYYLSQIITSLFVIIGVVVGVWQYYLNSRAEISKMQLEKVQKAVELADLYKATILKKFSAVRYVYKTTKIAEIIQTIKKDDMKRFNRNEMTHLLSESDINKLKEIQKSDAFFEAVLEAKDIYGLNLRNIKKPETENNTADYKDHERYKHSVLTAFFSDLIYDILNSMESFSMYFTHKAADDSVIYQSIHQSFLEIVQKCYYHIAYINDGNQGDYYTNVTELYSKWYKESMDNQNKQDPPKQKGTVVDDLSQL